MVFYHDIILESFAIILLHLALWRDPMRTVTFYIRPNHHVFSRCSSFTHTDNISWSEETEGANNKTSSAYNIMLMQVRRK